LPNFISTYWWRLLSANHTDDQATGFLKIVSTCTSQLLGLSGGQGFFIDNLARHGPKPVVDGVTPLILGNPGSNITKEYERCFSEAEGSGVALREGKGTTLGERRSKADAALPVEPKTTHWQVEGAPRAWSVEKFAIF